MIRSIIKLVIMPTYFFIRSLALQFLRVNKIPFTVGTSPRILVIRLDRIGDMVLTTPIFKILKQHFPGARITVLAGHGAKDVLDVNPYIESIVIHTTLKADIRALAGKFDIVIDPLMNYDLLPALIARFVKAPCTIGFDIESRGMLFTSPIELSKEHKHFTAHFADLLASLHIAVKQTDLIPEIFATKYDSEILKLPANDTPIICIHPGGFYASQRWPESSFAQLITLCSQKYPSARYLLLGTETEVIKSIMNLLSKDVCSRVLDIKSKCLRDTIHIINHSALFIGNNSGLLHIATALKVPTVSTMGPTIPWLWHPCGPAEKNVVVKSSMKCVSCDKGYGEGHTCLSSISAEEVFGAVQKVLV
jgi:ADP-heptose:LPS heptosyltransferase